MNTRSEIQRSLAELGLQSCSSVDLMSFTTNLLESNKIGSGGYGEVYIGQLPKGVHIAVKVLENMDLVEDTFMVEVYTMGKACHRNLIKLYGYCFEENMQALVYEYMENGSLDKFLYENNHGSIEWVKLYAIAIDTANGLKYLHHDLEEQIIHHDIKAANVLLDKNLSAKITDFGLARIMNRDVSRVDLTGPRGTQGYTAPEAWMLGSQVTSKCDVYSFGMMLFEVLGKRKNGRAENWFPGLVWKQFENGNLEHFIRTNCDITENDRENANILCKVALWCVQYNPNLRPSMKDVVLMLEKEKLVKDPPCPSFEFRGRLDEMELDSTYTQNIIPGPSHALVAGSCDGGVALPQQKSNKRKTRSPNVLEEDLATLVPNKGMKLPTTKLVGKTTALKYKEMILQLIAKDEVITIGVHGMGGVGKTTIFKHVHNQLLDEGKCFDKIIWVTISQDGNITKLQNDLAKELALTFSHEDDVLGRSRLLFQALRKRKRVVFFFDDMWNKISLEEIGIPEPTQENGCKLLLTTRKLEVCKRMGCHETIKVEGLPKDEAWELLMDKIDCVLSPEVEEIAEMVAKKCSNLPLAIITVGGAMRRNSDIDEWRVALNDLNLRDPSNRMMDMEDIVYECLKFSYDRLENEKQRKCFLFCALYPEDYKIVIWDLVDFWIMDGLVVGRNRQEELVNGQYILNKLKGHCLLETVDVYDEEIVKTLDGVKMHDSIRDMALRLTNKCFMVRNGLDLLELPNEEEWGIDLEKASFMDSCMEVVTISPICPNLSTLIIRGDSLMSITHDFFVHMKSLKILDLEFADWYSDISSLPNSISDLMNLRVLRLQRNRSLKKLPSLAKLVLLRKLDLNKTCIEELPEGIEMLVNLRCLTLNDVKLKERIPIGLISKFSLLQELYLGGIDVDKLYDLGRGESFAKELLSLKHLENLSVTFHCLFDYVSYVQSPKFNGLKCFCLAIGQRDVSYTNTFPPQKNTIRISHPPDEHIALVFPKNTKHVDIRECKKIECIWSSKDENQEFSATATSSSCWLQSVERIYIEGCTKLYTIFEGIPNYTSGVLPVFCLKELTIYNCNNLKKVFPSSRLLQLLQNLKYISIIDCDELEEFIGDDDEEETETPIAIPRLKDLDLSDLPKLKGIRRGVMICDSLEVIDVTNCYKLKSLPQLKGEEQSTPPPALRTIKGGRKWWDSLEWDPAYPKNILQPFFKGYFEEEEQSSQSDEPAPEGAGIDRPKTFQLDLNVPVGYVCHNCEMYPIVGKHYTCKDCWEKRSGINTERGIGFDLCEECYTTISKSSDLVNYHHTQGHTLELIADGGDSPVPEVLLRD